jgi:anaerobic selenocysteine-containing dehydrogenase
MSTEALATVGGWKLVLWGMSETRRTICNRDCPDACGIVATVEDGRITRIQGDPNHPVTQGFLCYRTNQFLRRQYAEDRLTKPLVRTDGELKPASWDEALDRVASELCRIREESGPEAVFHYRSGGTLGMLVAQISDLFFERFGPVTVKRGDICSGAGEEAQNLDFGVSDSSDLDDLLHAKHIILWGKNVFTSSPHTIPVLKRARERGAELVLVDPVHHETRRLCHRFVQPRPAGDFALAMAVARRLFERGFVDPDAPRYCRDLEGFEALAMSRSVEDRCAEADVAPEVVDDLAGRFHEGPVTILVGWGMARRKRGGAIVRALDALGAVSGNVGRRGAGVSYYFQRRRAFRSLTSETPPRTIPEPLFGPEVLRTEAPPIRAIWVTAGNPAAMLPDANAVAEALRTRELTVVVDSWLSDTAELADVVLPTNTLLEADDLVGAYGHHHIGEARPVVSPPPDVKSDLEIFQALSERVGLGGAFAGDAEAFKRRLLRDEVPLERLREGAVRNPLADRVIFEGRRFATDDGRAHLVTEGPGPLEASPHYPLTLLSLSTPSSQSSQWAKDAPQRAVVTVHPDSAGGVADGEEGELVSAVGALVVRVKHDDRQRRDVAIVPKGGHLRDGACANAITRAQLTDIGEGGALYDEPVLIRPLSRP